jgi:hypothetical protein
MPTPHGAQLKGCGIPQLGNGENAGAAQPLLHAPADAVDVLELKPEQNAKQVFLGYNHQAVGLLQIGTDLAEKDVRCDADRAGKALADLLAQGPLDLERQYARGLDLALGSHQPAGHLVDRHDLLDRQAGVDGFENALVILGVEPVIGLHRDDGRA